MKISQLSSLIARARLKHWNFMSDPSLISILPGDQTWGADTSDLYKNPIQRTWIKFYDYFINNPLLKIKNFFSRELKEFYTRPEIKQYKTILDGKLKAGNGGEACYLSSALNTLRAWFVLHHMPIPPELQSYEGAIKFAVRQLKSDPKYGHYFRHLEEGPALLYDYDADKLDIANIVDSILFKKYFGESYAEHLITRSTPNRGVILDTRALLRYIYELQHGNPSTMSTLPYREQYGHVVTALGLKPNEDLELFKKLLSQIDGRIPVSELKNKMEAIKPVWNTALIIAYDQAAMMYREYSLGWCLFDCKEFAGTTPKSIFAKEAGARNIEKLHAKTNFDSNQYERLLYDPKDTP